MKHKFKKTLAALTGTLGFAVVMLNSWAPAVAGEVIVHNQSLPVKIASAPAVGLADDPQFAVQLQVVRTEDNRIFYSISHSGHPDNPGYPIRGWAEIPGGGRTEYQLAVHHSVLLRETYVAAVGLGGNGFWLQALSWNTGRWRSSWKNHGGAFSSPPEIAVNSHGNEIVLLGAAKNDSDRLYYNRILAGFAVDGSSDGQGWFKWGLPINTREKIAARWYEPDLTFNNDYLLVVVHGNNGRLYNAQGVRDGNKRFHENSVWFEIPGNGLTNHGPAMTGWSADGDLYAEVLWLAVRGTNGGVYYTTYQNNCWKGEGEYCPAGAAWTELPTQGATPYGPSLYTLGTVNGLAGPVFAVTETPSNGGGIAYQSTRPNIPNPPGPQSHFHLQADPSLPGWALVKGSRLGLPGSGTHPEEVAAGWSPSWTDANGTPIPSPVNGPVAVQNSEAVNQWYRWCQIFFNRDGQPNGQQVQQWMPGESQNQAFADLVAWLDVHHPIGGGGGWLEQNGPCTGAPVGPPRSRTRGL